MYSKSKVSSVAPLLKDRAYLQIKEAILEETFTPGELLSEKRLIEFLGMSKTPIKSALDRLEAEGFVVVSPKQGILVKELSATKVSDIFGLRIAMELYVCESICGRLRSEQLSVLQANLAEQNSCMERDDQQAYTKADAEFHLLLCQFSNNEEIYQVMLNYQTQLYRFALKVIQRVPGRMQQAYQDHIKLVEALHTGDLELALKLMREHLVFGKSTLSG